MLAAGEQSFERIGVEIALQDPKQNRAKSGQECQGPAGGTWAGGIKGGKAKGVPAQSVRKSGAR